MVSLAHCSVDVEAKDCDVGIAGIRGSIDWNMVQQTQKMTQLKQDEGSDFQQIKLGVVCPTN